MNIYHVEILVGMVKSKSNGWGGPGGRSVQILQFDSY